MRNVGFIPSRCYFLSLGILLSACASLPPAAPPRPDTGINAPFSKTWDAVVDYFARSSIPVKTIDHSSGLIAAEATVLTGDNSAYATCSNGFLKFQARGASFNALIRGDSTHSTVRVTTNWMTPAPAGSKPIACVSSDLWEKQFESAIKTKAESP